MDEHNKDIESLRDLFHQRTLNMMEEHFIFIQSFSLN